MNQSDSLYRLVKSLSKTEKANFRKFSTRHVLGSSNRYLILFDALANSHGAYDEKSLKLKFQKERFVKNFPVIKNYLYENILKSLSVSGAVPTSDQEIKNDIRYVEVLYKKGLFKDSKRILNRALKKAGLNENFQGMLELLRWEKNLINEGMYEGDQFSNLEKAHRAESEIIERLKNLSDYRFLSYRVRNLIIGSPEIRNAGTKLARMLNEPLLRSEDKALSYNARILFNHTLAAIHESLDNNIEALHYRKKLLATMEARPEKFFSVLPNYIVSAYNLLGTCFNLKKYDELVYYLNKLRSIDETYGKKLSKNDRLMIIVGSSIYELRMYINLGEFGKLSRGISDIETGLVTYNELIERNDKLYLYYLLCYSYFGAGKIDKALSWMNRILNDKEIIRDTRLYTTSLVVNLILHYELGNFELLEYLIKSAYRFLRINRHSGIEEQIVLEFMRKLPDITSRSQLKGLFEESLNKLKSSRQVGKDKKRTGEPPDKGNILSSFTSAAEFDMESWLESKINGKKFDEIIRQKASG